MRTSKDYLFRACYSKGVGYQYLCLAETQRQAEEPERFILNKRVDFRCALMEDCWYRKAVDGLRRIGNPIQLVVLCLVAQSCSTLCNPMDCSPPGSSVHEDSPGKNTRWDCHALLQRIFLTQGSNPGLPQCRQILYHLSPQWGPRILEWVAYPFFRETCWTRNPTGVPCIAGGFFTLWATWEAHVIVQGCLFAFSSWP